MKLVLVSLRLKLGQGKCEKGLEVFLEGCGCNQIAGHTWGMADDRFCFSLFRFWVVNLMVGVVLFLWAGPYDNFSFHLGASLHVGSSVGWQCPSWDITSAQGLRGREQHFPIPAIPLLYLLTPPARPVQLHTRGGSQAKTLSLDSTLFLVALPMA